MNLGGQATVTELANVYGRSSNWYLSQAISLAKRIVDKYPYVSPYFDGVKSKWWPILFIGKEQTSDAAGVYIWRIRDELSEALDDVDWSGYEFLEGKPKNELPSDDASIFPTTKAKPYNDKRFLEDVYVSADDLASMKRLLKRKKNLILQGAPGTGKTYCAKRLAWAFMGEEDNNRICFVQFHQNTAYDDLMAGFRPSDNGSFEAVPGEFIRFCDMVAQDPDQKPWFFIIDEINRANISKVFGELLMLIESGHRDEPLKLSILGRSVKVPSNLYIVGMMNTADRGLALIDYALRRRFAFFEMNPAYDCEQFEAYIKSTGNEKLFKLSQAVYKLNQEIASNPSFGSGFRIGHSYFCLGGDVSDEDVSDIVEYEIDPLLREYWFDAPDIAEDKINQLKAAL